MRLVSYIAVLACLFASGAALALPAAEARAQVQRARDGAQALRQHQTQLRVELDEVAGRIQELKAQQRGRLIPGSELSGLLRRSQELSGALTEVESGLVRAEGEMQEKRGALAEALDAEMDAARAAFERAGHDERRTLLERMQALRKERDQVRAQLPAARLPQVKAEASDDPTDLLEQADALRDTQDKVASRLKALERRIAEVKRERELDRRMGEFLGDEQAFDEHDRRLATSPTASDAPPPRDARLPAAEHSEPIFPSPSATWTRPRSPARPPPATGNRRSALERCPARPGTTQALHPPAATEGAGGDVEGAGRTRGRAGAARAGAEVASRRPSSPPAASPWPGAWCPAAAPARCRAR